MSGGRSERNENGDKVNEMEMEKLLESNIRFSHPRGNGKVQTITFAHALSQ